MIPQAPGTVSLVGAGPGDPGLLTLKGKQRLEEADVVVHDHLVSPAVMTLVPSGVERIYVGKWAGERIMSQEAIGEVLVEQAKKGRRVVRLKGGDVFLFGRGGEECSCLEAHGIEFEIVPGVSSALAVPAYAGIPITDRRYASSVMVVTGHDGNGEQGSRVDWEKVATASDTLVILMGTRRMEVIMEQLMAHGRPGEQPAAMISWGTLGQQETIVGTIATLPTIAEEMKPPTVIVVGEVVRLRDTVRWFESRPLFGMRIINTRPLERAGELTRALAALGAKVIDAPLISCEIREQGKTALQESLQQAEWLVVTSVFAVRALEQWGIAIPPGCSVAAVGEACRRALEDVGIGVHLVPDDRNADALCEALVTRERDLSGKRIVFPKGSSAKDTIEARLGKSGAKVRGIVVYEVTPLPELEIGLLNTRLNRERIDAVMLTSPLNAKIWAEQVESAQDIPSIVISETVASVLRNKGCPVGGVARRAGDLEMVEALHVWASKKGSNP